MQRARFGAHAWTCPVTRALAIRLAETFVRIQMADRRSRIILRAHSGSGALTVAVADHADRRSVCGFAHFGVQPTLRQEADSLNNLNYSPRQNGAGHTV